jgi:hypothetical protein
VTRPFAGRADETEWVALREVVPAATAPLHLRDAGDRDVTLSTVLPLAWPAMVRADGRIFLGLQVAARSGDVSRDLGWALELALAAEPGTAVQPVGLPGPGPRLQDLLTDDPIEVTVHEGFDYWVDGAVDEDSEVAEGGRGPLRHEASVPLSAGGSADAERGRGLAIVSLLTASWGSAFDSTSAVVWADVAARQVVDLDAAEQRQEA